MLMYDAKQLLSPSAQEALSKGELLDILYADDTLILGQRAGHVEEYARAVESADASYGMKLHWGKTQALCIGQAECLKRPDGSLFEDVTSLHYLCAILA